jgi:hypothetical protein
VLLADETPLLLLTRGVSARLGHVRATGGWAGEFGSDRAVAAGLDGRRNGCRRCTRGVWARGAGPWRVALRSTAPNGAPANGWPDGEPARWTPAASVMVADGRTDGPGRARQRT